MKVLVVAILAIFCAASINAGPTLYIQNGATAEKNDHSVIILALGRVTDHRAVFGGGSVLSRRHILTAAHLCVNAKLFRIGYGHIKAREVIRLNASSALIHSHFNAKTLENDLAIITLPQNQLINVEIGKPIIIASRAVAVKDIGNVSSFGFESDSGTTISENLMVARQVVIENNACAEAFNRPVHHNQFCGQDPKTLPTPPEEALPEDDPTPEISGETSGSNEGSDGDGDGGDGDGNDDDDGDDAHNTDDAWANGWGRRFGARVATQNQQTSVCRGDTGSALVRKSDKGYVAFGIVSRVPRGCNSELPALYTLLPAFTQWLEDATLGEVEIEKVQE